MPCFGDFISKTKGFFRFSFNKRSPKDTLGKLSVLHTVHHFSKTKRKSTKTIMRRRPSCQNKSVRQKLTQSCKR